MGRRESLNDWLQWLEQLHPQAIDLGLQRVFQAARQLELFKPATSSSHSCSSPLAGNNTIVTVAGTNGKGSCVRSLEQMLLAKKLSVASYTSPHLHHFRERIRINGHSVSEDIVVEAFAAVDVARQSISLTYFEFTTLAALWIFVQQNIPFVLLEVGLGGRLDAVNIIDADIAIITSIALDHQDWLGNDRDTISREKLGIAREGHPLIIAESEPTVSLARAAGLSSTLLVNRDFHFTKAGGQHWHFDYHFGGHRQQSTLLLPGLPLASVASALCVIQLLGISLSGQQLEAVMTQLHLPGRFQEANMNGVPLIYDVAHNPSAVVALMQNLADRPVNDRTLAVFALLAEKDLDNIVAASAGTIDHWFTGELKDTERVTDNQRVIEALQAHHQQYTACSTIEDAFDAALSAALSRSDSHRSRDRIVIFGSFHTVARVQNLAGPEQQASYRELPTR